MRTCILCIPRSGSQYCERLIASLEDKVTMLGEYFESWNESDYSITNGELVLEEFAHVGMPFGVNQRYQERLDLLESAVSEQNFTIRLFIFADYDILVLSEIVTRLHALGFKFVNLVRDFRDVAISYSIAQGSRFMGNSIFTANSTLDSPITIDVDRIRPILNRIYRSHNMRNDLLTALNIPYDTVSYDTLPIDIGMLFNRHPVYEGIKTLNNDPASYVVNTDTFFQLINEYE